MIESRTAIVDEFMVKPSEIIAVTKQQEYSSYIKYNISVYLKHGYKIERGYCNEEERDRIYNGLIREIEING